MTAKQKTQVSKLLHDYSKKRREAKDEIALIKPLVDLLEQSPKIINDIGKVANEMNKVNIFNHRERVYKPRVLESLFTQ